MAIAILHKPSFSLAGIVRDLFAGRQSTSDASVPTNLRTAESAYLWSGTTGIADDIQQAPSWVVFTQEGAPNLAWLTPTAGSLAKASTATNNPDYGMAALAIAADNGDEHAFLAAKSQIDWSQRCVSDFVEAIQLALAAGAHRAASKLAVYGAEKHPDSAELRLAAHILAPPTAVVRRVPANPSAALDMEWLQAHRNQYRGLWVALRSGNLLGSADTLSALTTKFGSDSDILYTRVV